MVTTAIAAHEHSTIDPGKPFDFDHSLWFLRSFLPCSGDHACSTDGLVTGGYADGVPFVARLVGESDGTLTIAVEWLDAPGDVAVVRGWLASFLSLDDDLTDLYATARTDPAFERVVEDLYGYHHVRFSTPFEAACWAALSQRTPIRVAKRLKRDLVALCGESVERDGAEVLLFPTPEMVRDVGPAVDDVIEHDRKAKTVLAAAEAFASENLDALDDRALRTRLGEVWGFGDWSSEFVALRGFGRLSGIPRTERRLREAVADLYDLADSAADDETIDHLSAPYRPLEGCWAHYIRVWAFRQNLDS